jgi:cell division protein FtsN
MSRLDILTVVIVAICLAALGYLLFKTFNMIGGGPELDPDRTEYTDTATDGLGTDDTYDPYEPETPQPVESESELTEDVPTVEGQEGYAGTTGDNTNFDSDYAEPSDPAPATTPPPASTPASTPATQSTTGYSEGKYMVIAGTFRQLSNAERRVSELLKMGYSETRVSKFNRGAYAVALVNRFSSLSSARQLERELEAKGIEAEVITE